MTSPTFYTALFLLLISCITEANEGVFDKIKAGLENAKNYLDTVREIADLVAKSLKPPQQAEKRRGDEEPKKPSFEPTDLVATFFRLLGLDAKKISAVAVNSFIFFAQIISEFFKISPKLERAKSLDEDEYLMGPIRLITNSENEKVQNLFYQAQDKHLPERLIQFVDGFDLSCIKLLLCKTSPVIWAAQKSLKNTSTYVRRDITSWLPSREEFEDYSDSCDDKHQDCPIPYKPS